MSSILYRYRSKLQTEGGSRLPSNYEIEVGSQIRTHRIRQNLTQEDLARLLQLHGCDITRGTLAKIEAGTRHIYLDELKALKEVLRVHYDDLLSPVSWHDT